MDRRTILAFILIGLVIVLMPHYMRWIRGGDVPEAPPQGEERVVQKEVPPVDPGASRYRDAPGDRDRDAGRVGDLGSVRPDSGAAVSDEGAPLFVARPVKVETDRYVAVFTTQGGRLVSFRLKDYHSRRGGGWLELVGPGGSGLGLSIDGKSMDAYEFEPSRESLVLSGTEQDELVLRGKVDGGWVEKRHRFQGNRYRMDVAVQMSGFSPGAKLGVRWEGGLPSTEGTVKEDAAYAKVVTRVGGEVENWDVGDLGEDMTPPSGMLSWVGVRSKYFLVAVIPSEGRYDTDLSGVQEPSGAKQFHVELLREMGETPLELGVYVGPISYDVLRAQNRDLDGRTAEVSLDEFMNYGWAILHPIMKPITIVILRAFFALHQVVPNYGLVIVIFSILVKIVVFPLTHKSLESTAKMQKLQPQMAALKEKYADDQQKLNQEMMKLYKDQKVNPVGGCLPMLFQMPILISLFNVFRGAIELRQSGFVLWMDDLSQPDRLWIGGFEIHVLPLLMAASMFVQQKMTMKDPKQAMLVYIMPVFMTWIFWSMSSGLVLYWTMFNLLTLAQQHVMERTKAVLGTE